MANHMTSGTVAGKAVSLFLATLLYAAPSWAQNREELQRKIDYAHLLINVSEQARRISASDNEEAKKLRDDAEKRIQNASMLMEKGELNKAAEEVDEAFRLYTTAAQLVPDPKLLERHQRETYARLLNQAFAFEAWGKDNMEPEVIAWIRERIDKAQGLVLVGYYDEANKLLTEVLDRMIGEMSQALDSKTITYDLDFQTPDDEYRYEDLRNKDYIRLVPIAIAQRHPSEVVLRLVERLVQQGKDLRKQAETEYDNAHIKKAISTMQKSTERLQKALKMMGVH